MGFAVTSYPNTTPLVGLFSSQIKSEKDLLAINSGETTLGINTFRYDQMFAPTQAIDQITFSNISDVNTAKGTILSTADGTNFYNHEQYYGSSSDAQTATQNLFNDAITFNETCTNLKFLAANVSSTPTFSVGIAVSSTSGGTGIVAISRTPTLNTDFSVVIHTVSGTFVPGQIIFVGAHPGVAFTDLSSVDFVGSAQLYNDVVIETFYPNLEPPNMGVENPFSPIEFNILDSSNRGLGVANTFYSNSLSGGSIVNSDTTNNSTGRVFVFDVSSGASEKSTIDAQLTNISISRSSLTTPNNNASTLKGHKKGFSVNRWTLGKSTSQMNQNITDLESLVSILENSAYGGPY